MRRFVPHALIAAVAVIAVGWSVAAAALVVLPRPGEDYNSPGFIVRHAWQTFAFRIAEPFREDLDDAEQDRIVARFFELNGLIADQERSTADDAAAPAAADAALDELRALRSERAEIENTVEAILAARLTDVLEDAGLTRDIGFDVVWPPVAIEFEDPPVVLVESPRDAIERRSERLLQGDLPIERVQGLESEAEADGETSALVVRIGGIAMYPAIIPQTRDYRSALHTIAHEWLHHYLFFTPLGRGYFDGGDVRTLNETVANIAGRELGDMVYERYPPPEVRAATMQGEPARLGDAIDFTAELRGLRREVDALLARGQVDEAERLMEATRRYLADNGHYIRRINQAYFAFYGSYADGPASIDPIGPKLAELRERSDSVMEFLRTARELTSLADLDAALVR